MKATKTCGIIPGRNGKHPLLENEDESISECILRTGHESAHVLKRQDGVYVKWAADLECGCCEPDNQVCFWYGEISEQDALALLVASHE